MKDVNMELITQCKPPRFQIGERLRDSGIIYDYLGRVETKKSSDHKYVIRCDCGNKYTILQQQIHNRTYLLCKDCTEAKRAENRKKTLAEKAKNVVPAERPLFTPSNAWPVP